MRKVDTWMPLYVADYLADTMRLTCEQHGAYMLLIMDYWRNGPPPDDDVVLAQITRCTAVQWAKLRPVIANHFRVEGGSWLHDRIERELVTAKDKATVAGAKAKAAADARWNPSRNAPGMQQALPGAKHEECPSPSPTQIVNLYHVGLPSNPRVKLVTDQRAKHIHARWAESALLACSPFNSFGSLPTPDERLDAGLKAWGEFFAVCAESKFLTNQVPPSESHPNFKVDFDWLMNPSNFAKVIENKYHGEGK